MKIVSLGRDRQYGIKSGVVNVPIDVRKTIQAIPSRSENCGVIEVSFMRSMRYKHHYKRATIRPDVVWKAAKLICETELYKQEGIVLDNGFNEFDEGHLLIPGEESSMQETSQMESTESNLDDAAMNEEYIEEKTMLSRLHRCNSVCFR